MNIVVILHAFHLKVRDQIGCQIIKDLVSLGVWCKLKRNYTHFYAHRHRMFAIIYGLLNIFVLNEGKRGYDHGPLLV